MSGYYTAHQGAKLLGVSAATIRTWVHRGHLPAGTYSAGVLRWTKAQLVSARERARGGSASPAAALNTVIDARCGCGTQCEVTPGLSGYTMLTCVNCAVTIAVERAGEYVYRDRVDELDIAPTKDTESVLGSRVAVLTAKAAKGRPLVYFIRLGPYVKIGTSVDVLARIGALSLAPGNLLAVIPGSYDEERATHRTYARLRAFREWFYLQDELKAHIVDLQRKAVEDFTTTTQPVALTPR